MRWLAGWADLGNHRVQEDIRSQGIGSWLFDRPRLGRGWAGTRRLLAYAVENRDLPRIERYDGRDGLARINRTRRGRSDRLAESGMTVGVHHGDPPEQQSLVLVPGDSGRHLVRSVGTDQNTRPRRPSPMNVNNCADPMPATAGYVQHDTVKVEGSRKVLLPSWPTRKRSLRFFNGGLLRNPPASRRSARAWSRAA